MLVERFHQGQQLFAGLVIHRDGVLRLPGHRRFTRLAELRFERLGNVAVGFLRRINLVAAFV